MIRAVYEAMKDRLLTVGLNAYEFVPGASEWPAALILPPMVEHEGLSDDWLTLRFDIVVMVSGAIDENQLQLMEYQAPSGPKSIAAAFRSAPTLGGLAGDARVARSRPLGYEEQAGYEGFGCVFETVVRIG